MTKVFLFALLTSVLILCKCNQQNAIRNFLPRDNETFIDQKLLNGEVEAYCFVNMNGVVYDLSPLYDSSADYILKRETENFYFNFCKFSNTKCKKDHAFIMSTNKASVVNNTSNDCLLLSGTNYNNIPKWKIENAIGKPTKIRIELPEGDHCDEGNVSTFYKTIFEIKCDKNTARLAIDNIDTVSSKKCENVIKLRSQHACPNLNKYSLNGIIKQNSVIFGLILMAVGIYYCFFSYKYVRVTRVMTGVLTVCFVSFFLFAANVEIKFSNASFWITFIISILIGLFFGYIIAQIPWLVSAVLGAFLGFIFTELLYQAIVSSLSWNPKAVYYIIFSLSIVIGAVLGGIFQKHIFIISCAFTGAYSMMRGLGTLENNFPDEKQLYDLLEREEWSQASSMIDYRFYLYLLFAFVLGCVGVCHQYKSYFKDIKEEYSDFNKID